MEELVMVLRSSFTLIGVLGFLGLGLLYFAVEYLGRIARHLEELKEDARHAATRRS